MRQRRETIERRSLAHLCRSLKGSNRDQTGHLKFCSNGGFVRTAAVGAQCSELPLRAHNRDK
jgi:hypothetical protein